MSVIWFRAQELVMDDLLCHFRFSRKEVRDKRDVGILVKSARIARMTRNEAQQLRLGDVRSAACLRGMCFAVPQAQDYRRATHALAPWQHIFFKYAEPKSVVLN
ncbi:hypothetical protein F511_35393 [Dorcoceras hygrometricum]|uniref:Uncharacterized protein n=1 Tax=Dorcoceras hygrometricum TaxID=472368 RepID=A0A2Z7CFU1_9LAMI|nr:hypothetical protein F511_35393 [Dorcoceras hygrometricum]